MVLPFYTIANIYSNGILVLDYTDGRACLLFLKNLIIIKTKVLLPQA